MPAPVAWELTGGVGGGGAPRVPGAAEHLTPIRHWVAYADDELTVAWATLQAPLVMLGDLHLPYAPFPATIRPSPAEPGTVYSWAMNNIWDTNFPAQQEGETTFRYAIGSAVRADPRALGLATAAGFTDPLVAVPLTGAGGTEAAAEGRFVTVGHPLVRVASIGVSRRGHDLVVHLASAAGEDVTVPLRVPGLRTADLGTSLERGLRPLRPDGDEVAVPVPACGFVAVSVGLDGGAVAAR
jgi:hypothetical protein